MSTVARLAIPWGGSAEQPAPKKLSVATIGLALLILWLPLQTPLAIVVFQYGHHEKWAQALLLVKDVYAALLIAYLLVRYWRRLTFYWFDWAAIAYAGLIVVYSIVPWLLGSHIGVTSVVASARELAVPIELYALGRLAVAGGADIRWLVAWALAVAAAAAAFTVCVWAFTPRLFWSTTLDLVTFVRVVQGIPNVQTLWDISILARLGGGLDYANGFVRAVGPFTQPVGTGHYFVLPVVMTVAFFYQAINQRRLWAAGAMAAAGLLFVAAVIVPISRGAWIAVALAVVLCSLVCRRRAIIFVGLALAAAALVMVPAVRFSVVATVTGTDSSASDHASALGKGISTVIDNPIGLGVGQSDQFGQVLGSGDTAGAGVGENMYITLLVSVGPLGLLAFLVWSAGLIKYLIAVRHRAPPPSWIVIGSGAALVGYLVTALLAPPLMRFTTSATVWLVVGLAMGSVLAASRLATNGDGEGDTDSAAAGDHSIASPAS